MREDGEEGNDGLESVGKIRVVYTHARLRRCARTVEKLLSRRNFHVGSNVRKLLLWSCFSLRKIIRQTKEMQG